MRFIRPALFALIVGAAMNGVSGQDQSSSDKYVSKEEYLKLKEEHDHLKQEMEALKARHAAIDPKARK